MLGFLCSFHITFAQETNLELKFTVKNQEIQFKQAIEINEDTVQFEKIALLLSNFYFVKNGVVIDSLSKKYHYLQADDPSSLKIQGKRSNNLSFDHLRFTFGIDSLTHSLGVLGGDLDPMFGHYWTWQSGYIFLKIEGTSPNCPGRKNRFQFHIGGYQVPFVAFQTLEIPFKETYVLALDLDKLIDSKAIRENYQIMSPSEKSVDISHRIQTAFHFWDAN